MGWNHRRAVPVIVAVLGLGTALGGCGSPPTAATDRAATWNDLPSAAPGGVDTAVPSATVSAPAAGSAPATPPASSKPATKPATTVTYTFPVIGHNSYAHTHHDYPATDIITACGNRVVAAASGVILAVTRTDTWKASVDAGATRGGLSVSLLGDDGVRYYGSHLSVVAAGINPGVRVRTGTTIGKIGETGDAGACHLHFGISPPCARVGDWWTQRGAIYPWPYLDAWKKGVNKSAVAAVAAWQKQHGCPKKPLVDP